MLNPGKTSSFELLLRTMYLLRIHHKITFKSECKVGHPNIMKSVPLPHPSTPYFLMPNPGEVASLGLLFRTMYLSRIYQKTLYGSECKVCCHGCRTIAKIFCDRFLSELRNKAQFSNQASCSSVPNGRRDRVTGDREGNMFVSFARTYLLTFLWFSRQRIYFIALHSVCLRIFGV